MQGNNKKQKPPGEFKLSDPPTPIAGNSYPDQKQVVYDEAVRRLENEVYTFKMLKDGRPAQRPAGISLSMPIRLQENLDPPSQTSSITESTAGRREIPRQKASPNEKRVVWTGELERVSKVNSPGRTEDDNISVVSKASQIASTVGRVAGAFAHFVSSGATSGFIDDDEEEEEQSKGSVPSDEARFGWNFDNTAKVSTSLLSPKVVNNLPQCKPESSTEPNPKELSEAQMPNTDDVKADGVSVDPSIAQGTFLNDNPSEMTFGRRMARRLSKYTWYYNPQAVRKAQEDQRARFRSEREELLIHQAIGGNKDAAHEGAHESFQPPNLDMAWAHFEHVTLPRYVKPSLKNSRTASVALPQPPPTTTIGKLKQLFMGSSEFQNLKVAEPGESTLETRLYSVYYTPLSQMGDFGLGIGLYFSTLQCLSLITFIAGLICVPNLQYYKSKAYSALGQVGIISSPSLGSAICTDQQYVICEDCNFDQFVPKKDDTRLATSEDGSVTFALKNNCLGAQFPQGIINLIALFFVLVGMILMNIHQQKKAVEFDEDEQTAQDYSIVVTNPPKDAYDAKEWKKYFDETFDTKVTVCTVVVANDLLLQALAERRDRWRQLELQLPVGESTEINHIARLAAEISSTRKGMANMLRCLHPFGLALDIPALYERIVVLTERARGLAQRQSPVTKIFITFETEEDQRTVLSSLSYGKYASLFQKKKGINPSYLFRGTSVLAVSEPSEPSAVRWQNLDDNMKRQVISLSITTFVCIVTVVLIAFIVALCRDSSSTFAAVAISAFNAIFPMFAQFMTAMESHTEEGLKERSLYIKIAFFRWINTAVVINVVTPFTSTLTAGKEHLIYSVYAIFFAEIFTVNALQLVDIGGQIQRHFVAPRAPDQERMTLNFRGTQFFLAERYTTVTKVLFLNFYYCAVFPATFFFSAVAFALNYFVDKFSLMRTWAPAPKLGKQVADFSRQYFFSASLVAFAVMASYNYSGFPFDNLCDTGKVVNSTTTYVAFIGADKSSETSDPVTITAGDSIWKYCNQNFFSRTYENSFPALPIFQEPGSEWMTPSQERLTTIYGWTSVAFIALFLIMFLVRLGNSFIKFFTGGYSARGSDMNISYSDVEVIDAYIPQVKNENHSYPFIACNIDRIPEGLMSWKDPSKPYDFYNLYKDAEKIFEGTVYEVNPRAFSEVVHWNIDEDEDAEIARPYEQVQQLKPCYNL